MSSELQLIIDSLRAMREEFKQMDAKMERLAKMQNEISHHINAIEASGPVRLTMLRGDNKK